GWVLGEGPRGGRQVRSRRDVQAARAPRERPPDDRAPESDRRRHEAASHSPRAEESDDRVPGRRRASRLPEGLLPDERTGASRPLRERTQGREGEVLQGGLAAMGPPKRDADEAGRL